MARSEEKAAGMLNRWVAAQRGEAGLGLKPRRRPRMAGECKDLNECDKWRSQILREIGGKVMEIQNSSLEEARIRELDDEINKIMRVKHAWEKQILKLGGPNYIKAAAKTSDRGEPPQPHPFPNCFATAAADDSLYFFFLSSRTAGGAEYKYFGAARNLPGVKELFNKPKMGAKKPRRTKQDLLRAIDADYFGYRDEDDGVLVAAEAAAEEALSAHLLAEFEKRVAAGGGGGGGAGGAGGEGGEGEGGSGEGGDYVAFVPLPDEKDIERRVLDKKKEALLAKYVSKELREEGNVTYK